MRHGRECVSEREREMVQEYVLSDSLRFDTDGGKKEKAFQCFNGEKEYFYEDKIRIVIVCVLS